MLHLMYRPRRGLLDRWPIVDFGFNFEPKTPKLKKGILLILHKLCDRIPYNITHRIPWYLSIHCPSFIIIDLKNCETMVFQNFSKLA